MAKKIKEIKKESEKIKFLDVRVLRCPHCKKLLIGTKNDDMSLLEEWKNQK